MTTKPNSGTVSVSHVGSVGKYDEVLKPFMGMMEKELHANSDKGDRPGWLSMPADTCLLEIYYHLGKLQKAVKDGNGDGICEYAADVANLSMMLTDICGALALFATGQPADQQGEENYPPCDYCGIVSDYHPWHGSGMLRGVENRHIHACHACRDKLPAHVDQQGEPVGWAAWNTGTNPGTRLMRYDGMVLVSPEQGGIYQVPVYLHAQPATAKVVLDDVFDESQWWFKELEAAVAKGTPDQKRAVAVVQNLLGQIAKLNGCES